MAAQTLIVSAFHKIRSNASNVMNYLFVLFMFFLPMKGPTHNIFFAILVLFLIRGNFAEAFRKAFENRVVVAFIALFGVGFLWMYGSETPEQMATGFDRLKILLYPIIFLSFLKPEFVGKAFAAFIAGMFVSELTSYAIFFQVIDPILHTTHEDPSPFLHHTRYGLLLALTSGVLLHKLIGHDENPRMQVILAVFFVTITINIFITAGRMGYTLYFLSILIVLSMNRIKIWKIVLSLLLIVVIVLPLAYSFSGIFKKRFDESVHSLQLLATDNPFNSSFGSRLGFAYYAVPVIRDHWFVGVGTEDHVRMVYDQIRHSKDEFLLTINHLHNEHLNQLVQFGIVGFLVWLNLLYQLLRHPQTNPLLKTTLVLSVVLVFCYSFLDSFFKTHIAMLFIALWTLLLVKSEHIQTDHVQFSKKELMMYSVLIPTFLLIDLVS